MDKFEIIEKVVWLILCFTCFGVGLYYLCKIQKCARVMATCVECKNVAKSEKKNPRYQSTFTYVYNDQTYTTAKPLTNDEQLKEGQEYELYVNPKNPAKVYYPQDKHLALFILEMGACMTLWT